MKNFETGVIAAQPAGAPAGIIVDTHAGESEWDAFVHSRPEATSSHLWRWRTVFQRAFGHRAVYLAARRGGRIVGVLPLIVFDSRLFGRFLVSVPFINYGGVLASDDGVARALLREAESVAGRHDADYIELRHLSRQFPELPVKHHKVTMWLELGHDSTVAWNTLDRKLRNRIRKAEKSGLTTTSGGADLLPVFYEIFATNMRDLGTPVYSQRFFQEVLSLFPDQTGVTVVWKDATPIASAIRYRFRGIFEVPWAASLKAYRALCPNNLLYWRLIQDAVTSGAHIFDFGRSTPGHGTFLFKEQWGAVPRPVAWEYRLLRGERLPDQSPENPRYRTALAIWKRLPVSVTKWIGPPIVRSIP